MRRGLVWLSVAAAAAILAPAGCYSSSSPGTSTQDACVPVDATITASISGDSGACNACIRTNCETDADLVALCASECVCNDTALGALSCLDHLGGNASISAVTTCIAPLANASDPQLAALGGCVASNCLTACAGEPSDGSDCDAVGTSLTSLLATGAGVCESCLQANCLAAVTTCAGDCACNADTVTALECLANLGDGATFASAAACLGPLQSATINTPIERLLACLGSACGATCELAAPEGGVDASAPGDSSTMDVIITGAPDVGTDAPCPTCTGSVCCQQTELTSTADAPVAFWLDGTTLFWTANSVTAGGEILSFVVPPGTSTGLVTLLSTPNHTYGALGGSSTNLFFVDQTAGSVMTMPKTTGAVTTVAAGAGAGVAVQPAADGGAGVAVYFGGTSAVSWVPFPGAGSPTAAINLVATQIALDARNVYAVGLTGVGACPLGQATTSSFAFSTGTLSSGQGIFADAAGNVWIADQGTTSSNGAIYKCSAATGTCGAAFVSGRNHPFAVGADSANV